MSAAPGQGAHSESANVRAATRSDTLPLSETLARAFFDDPVMMHFLPEDSTREARLARVFRLLMKLARPYNSTFVTSGYEAATLWRPPNSWHVPFWAYIVNGPELLSIFGTGTPRVMSTMDMMEKIHPAKPHWYLQVIGTDPAKQGKGFASLIMRNQLARIDASGLPAYLESSKATNIPIYRNFGFEVMDEIKVPDGPTIWPMWRNAQSCVVEP